MENLGVLKATALDNPSLKLREEAGLRLVKEYIRLKDFEALEAMARKGSGYMPSVKEEAGNRLIDIYVEQRKASALRSIAENDNFPMRVSDRAWENAKLCALSLASGIRDLDELRQKHNEFIKNTPMQRKPKSVPPPRITPISQLSPKGRKTA